MSEPQRLQESDEIPGALREAFGALGREAPSAQTVLRVQRALQTLPAAAPGVAAVSTFGLSKLLVLVTLAAGAVISTLVLTRGAPAPREAERAERTPVQPVAQSQPVAQPQQVELPVAASEPQQVVAAVVAASPSPEPSKPHVGRPRAALSLPQGRASLRATRASSAAVSQRTDSQAVAPAPEPTVTPEQTTQAEPAPVAPVHTSEAEWLARCKRLAVRQPEQALQQLDLLARELPNGVFLQERELLAIRLHEQLGQPAKAEQLRQLFRARYPRSVYQRALPP